MSLKPGHKGHNRFSLALRTLTRATGFIDVPAEVALAMDPWRPLPRGYHKLPLVDLLQHVLRQALAVPLDFEERKQARLPSRSAAVNVELAGGRPRQAFVVLGESAQGVRREWCVRYTSDPLIHSCLTATAAAALGKREFGGEALGSPTSKKKSKSRRPKRTSMKDVVQLHAELLSCEYVQRLIRHDVAQGRATCLSKAAAGILGIEQVRTIAALIAGYTGTGHLRSSQVSHIDVPIPRRKGGKRKRGSEPTAEVTLCLKSDSR